MICRLFMAYNNHENKIFILKGRFIILDMYNGIIKKKKEFAFGQSAACTQSHVEFPLRKSQYIKHPTKKQDASKRGSKTKKRVDKNKKEKKNEIIRLT